MTTHHLLTEAVKDLGLNPETEHALLEVAKGLRDAYEAGIWSERHKRHTLHADYETLHKEMGNLKQEIAKKRSELLREKRRNIRLVAELDELKERAAALDDQIIELQELRELSHDVPHGDD